MMTPAASLSLTPYETVLQTLLAPLSPVPAREVALDIAEGLIAAGARAQTAIPAQDLARADGYAVSALSLIGASALSPVPLPSAPPWVRYGALLPPGTDAVLRADLLARSGPLATALGEVLPGSDVLRRGDWLAEGAWIAAPGARVTAAEVMLAEAAGLNSLECRVPKVTIILGQGGPDGANETWGAAAQGLMRALKARGAAVRIDTGGTPRAAAEGADLLVVLSETGLGPGDPTISRIAAEGETIAHGINLSAAPTLAAGRVNGVPLVALPGAPEARLAGLFSLIFPVLAALSGRQAPPKLTLPLARKVASAVGQAELLLLARDGQHWQPFPTGPLSPGSWRHAAGWCIIAAGDEGWPQGSPLAAELLEQGLPL